ncbi:unnamed protein product, partial [Mesorhabditis belari]|uniref:Glycosyltransferase family 92 protein n=1 Tax=Mesorhabditis belari TaxID=2138241 RepID=A0AAF3FIJ4_9BILA
MFTYFFCFFTKKRVFLIDDNLLEMYPSCPEYSCKHIAADITSVSFNEKPTEEIIVQRGTKSVKLKLNFVPKDYQPGITSCLEPLYWFTEWPRLIVFMELYQMIGYTKFLFTWTSMTKNVKKVLDYYVLKGLAELQPYPLMPYTDTALFLTEFAREPFTHWVERFFKDRNFYGTKPNEIVYLHARNSFERERLTNEQLNGTKNLMPDVDLLGKNPAEKLERIRTAIREIFGENPPPFTHETNDALDDCLKNWEVTQKGCRKPVTGCFDAVKFMEEWVFAKPTKENKWTLL